MHRSHMTIDARVAHYTAVSLAVDLASCIDLYYEYQDTDLAAAILAGDAITMIPVLPSMGALHGFLCWLGVLCGLCWLHGLALLFLAVELVLVVSLLPLHPLPLEPLRPAPVLGPLGRGGQDSGDPEAGLGGEDGDEGDHAFSP